MSDEQATPEAPGSSAFPILTPPPPPKALDPLPIFEPVSSAFVEQPPPEALPLPVPPDGGDTPSAPVAPEPPDMSIDPPDPAPPEPPPFVPSPPPVNADDEEAQP